MENGKEDIRIINEHFNDLLANYKRNLTEDNKALITKAFNFANKAHKGVRRKSGEPYILHPIAVARIATAEIGLGTKSIIAALLHDVVEDTEYTIEDIEDLFGPKIASIVEGLTKMSEVSGESSSLQAENFRKIVLTLSDDLRVILIKMADRLHNMRTLSSMPIRKQMKISAETLYIYAPLAHRMGLHSIKTELEDLSLKYEHPSEYLELDRKLKDFELENKDLFQEFVKPIKKAIETNDYKYSITARTKSVFSVWSKMQRKKIDFDEIYDLLAVRIVFKHKDEMPEKSQCWNIYSLITDIYLPKPERIRDWVSIPKANGYEALHVTVMGPTGKWIEVQIRTKRMDEIAEKGFAAHWKYKTDSVNHESELDKWLSNIREMLQEPQPDAIEFLDAFKLNLFTKEISVFTPRGDMLTFPKGASVLDFAYNIHTEVGSKCIGAKINKQLVPFTSKLKSGDQVEIITSESQIPSIDWLDNVITAKAKNNIKAIFKEERKKLIEIGIVIFDDILKDNDIPPTSKALRVVLEYFSIQSKDDFYRDIGAKIITIEALKKVLLKKETRKFVSYWKLKFWEKDSDNKKVDTPVPNKSTKKEFILDDYENFIISKCCNPIPGDEVVAVQNSNGTIVVHSRMCPNALRLMSNYGDKILTAKWVSRKLVSFLSVISLNGLDRIGIANSVTQVISKEHMVNMKSLNFDSHDGIFEGKICCYVNNLSDLENLIVKLSKIKGINSVKRVEHME